MGGKSQSRYAEFRIPRWFYCRVVNCVFHASLKPGRAGGAVRTSGFTRLSGCVFSGNRGYTGPAISNTVTMEIHSAEFDGNALFCGDGLFLNWATNVREFTNFHRLRVDFLFHLGGRKGILRF